MKRCGWAKEGDALLIEYHDNEYGRKRISDQALFEKLCLECFQAGLSWRTVLYKRNALREVFYGFDIARVADMNDFDIQRLMQDSRIIRNRRKIAAVIQNARYSLQIISEKGGLHDYIYVFCSGKALCDDLKVRGFQFAGETICTAFLESIGAIEGHEKDCFLHGQCMDQTI